MPRRVSLRLSSDLAALSGIGRRECVDGKVASTLIFDCFCSGTVRLAEGHADLRCDLVANIEMRLPSTAPGRVNPITGHQSITSANLSQKFVRLGIYSRYSTYYDVQ